MRARLAGPAVAGLLLALAAACSGGAESIQPGQWETVIHMTAGQAEPVTSTTTSCLGDYNAAEEALTAITGSDEGSSLLGGCLPTDPETGTIVDGSGLSNGEISTPAACMGSRGGPLSEPIMIRVRFEGRYTGTSVNSTFVVEEPLGRDGQYSGTLAARRTGDCPAWPTHRIPDSR